jgi:hypothetical protein
MANFGLLLNLDDWLQFFIGIYVNKMANFGLLLIPNYWSLEHV